MKVILFTRPDGGLTVRHPAPGARLVAGYTVDGKTTACDPPVPFDAVRDAVFDAARDAVKDGASIDWAETEEEHAQREMARVGNKAADVPMVVDLADVPKDRTFRDAWKVSGRKVDVDIAKARGVAKAIAAHEKLPVQDVDIDAATTPAELLTVLQGPA